jgi:hypothetical protein
VSAGLQREAERSNGMIIAFVDLIAAATTVKPANQQ